MSYQVIARKWRPQRFSDMVGQEHIARTLKNAIMSGRVAHAYLFVGPRGIGKTTSARIFAKALNCIQPVDGEPCCQCKSCKAIADESSVDVIEIDAATHTQVDKAREICEDVLHMPIASKYKIYIIDEVHMLSKSAWNALLKTIEEPPAHAKFIFATTEVNKVLPTVISRCQRFDLRRIPATAIAGRLKLIAEAEKVNISESAVNVIAHAADGGMRDAQSLLDQLISFFGDASTGISEEQALSLFGLTAPAEMESLISAILSNDRENAIVSIHKFAEQGKNLETLFEEITAWLRGILLCRILRAPQAVLEESPEKIQVFMRLAERANPAVIQRIMETLSASGYMLREAINKQVFIESILLKAMRLAHSVQVEDLIARLNQIRRSGELDALNSVVPLYELPPGQMIASKDSGIAATRLDQTPEKISIKEPTNIVQPPQENSSEKKTEPSIEIKSAPLHNTEVDYIEEITPESYNFAPGENPQSSSASEEKAVQEPSISFETHQQNQEFIDDYSIGTDMPELNMDVKPSTEVSPLEPDDEKENPEDTLKTDVRLDSNFEPSELWQKLILDVADNLKKKTLAMFMEAGKPESVQETLLTVAYDRDYAETEMLMVEREQDLLTMRLRAVSGNQNATLQFVRRQGIATPIQLEKKTTAEEIKKRVSENPLVQQTLQLFSGRLKDAFDSEFVKDSDSGE